MVLLVLVVLFDGLKGRAGSFIVGEGRGMMISQGLMVMMRKGRRVVGHAMAKVTVLHFGCLPWRMLRMLRIRGMQE